MEKHKTKTIYSKHDPPKKYIEKMILNTQFKTEFYAIRKGKPHCNVGILMFKRIVE